MPMTLRVTTLTACLMLVLAQGAAGMAVVPDTCLEKLSKQTRDWSVCTNQFSRSDERCKPASARMSARMQECTRKGYSKKAIDDAMTAGYRSAGKPKKS